MARGSPWLGLFPQMFSEGLYIYLEHSAGGDRHMNKIDRKLLVAERQNQEAGTEQTVL